MVVTGTGPYTYQWYRNGVAVPGATSASLSIASAAVDDSGSYTVWVRDSSSTF